MKMQLKKQRLCEMEEARNGYTQNNLQIPLNSGSEWCHWKLKSCLRISG